MKHIYNIYMYIVQINIKIDVTYNCECVTRINRLINKILYAYAIMAIIYITRKKRLKIQNVECRYVHVKKIC